MIFAWMAEEELFLFIVGFGSQLVLLERIQNILEHSQFKLKASPILSNKFEKPFEVLAQLISKTWIISATAPTEVEIHLSPLLVLVC